MPVTRYYTFSSPTSPPSIGPSTSQSVAFPWGTLKTDSTLNYSLLSTSKPSSNEQISAGGGPTLANTSRYSTFGGYAYYELGTQTIPSGTWDFAGSAAQSNTNVNGYFAVSIYVWRPSTSTVVGFIYDSQAQLGAEFATIAGTASRLFSVSGSSVTTQNGDVLVVELWITWAQSMSASYTSVTGYFNSRLGDPDYTADGQTGVGGWIDAPDTLVPVSSGPTTWAGEVTYSGASTYSSDDRLTAAAAVTYSGASTFSANGGLLLPTSASFAGSSTFTSDDRLVASGAVSYAGSSTFASDDRLLVGASVTYAGSSTYASDDRAIRGGAVTYAGSSTFSADGTLIAGTTTVAVPSTRLTLAAVAPARTPGVATVAVPVSRVTLAAVAPVVSQATQVAVPPSRVTLAAVAPARAATRSLAVPFARVTYTAIAPTRSPTVAVAVAPSSVRLSSVAPSVVAFIPIGVARVTLIAVAPSVTGGGGGGLKTLPRGSGDGLGSMTV